MCRHRFPGHDAEPADFNKIGSLEQRTFRMSCPPSFFFAFANQIGSFLLVDLRQPILSLIRTPMLLLALFLKRGPEPLNHSIEEFFH
jgi:hypothetical protein